MSHETDPLDFERRRTRARAERICDARIDAARGGPPPSANDAAWLDEQLEADPELSAHVTGRERAVDWIRKEPRPNAPEGFEERVMRAVVEQEPRRRSRGPAVVALFAAVAAAFALYVYVQRPPPQEEGVVVSGAVASVGPLTADFVVRPSDLGPAAARARLAAVVTAHRGTIFTVADGIDVRLPREALVGVLRDLARQGRFRVEKVSREPLPPDRQIVVLHVELE